MSVWKKLTKWKETSYYQNFLPTNLKNESLEDCTMSTPLWKPESSKFLIIPLTVNNTISMKTDASTHWTHLAGGKEPCSDIFYWTELFESPWTMNTLFWPLLKQLDEFDTSSHFHQVAQQKFLLVLFVLIVIPVEVYVVAAGLFMSFLNCWKGLHRMKTWFN